MKRTPFKSFFWLTVVIGCSGLWTTTPQPVRGQTNSSRYPVSEFYIPQSRSLPPVTESPPLPTYQFQLLDAKIPVPSWMNQTSSPIQQFPQKQETTSFVLQSPELEEANRLHQQVIQLNEQGKYNEAIPIAERVLEILERILGENHPDVASSMAWLAFLYFSQGRYSQAEPLYKQALEMTQKLLGTEHPDVATSLNNLALLYRSQGRYSQAEPLYKQALEMTQKLLGTEHPDVATSLNNLAILYQSQGRYNQAEPLLIQALEMTQKLLGTEHPDVATSLNNLAILYQSQGRYNQAEPLLIQALEMRQKLLGTEHPDVATSLNNLAALYESQGRYNEAEPLYRQALEMTQKLLGTEHPDVATSLNNLALLYSSQGRYNEAEPLYRQALEMRQKLLGTEHPDVATSLNNLALLYYSQGRYNEAEPLYRQALEMTQKLLGTEHPDVATSLNNLALLYYSQGRYNQAEPLYRQALEMYQKLLGTEHPDVATSLNNLASLYSSQGRYNEAEPLLIQALEMTQKLLGTEHPHVATSLNNLAGLYYFQGRYTEAINFLSRGLDVQEQNLNVLLATGSERQKQDSMTKVLGTTYQSISLHLKDAPNNLEAARLALTTLLRRKGRILDVMTNDLQLLRENITPENQQLLDELAAVRTQLATLIYNKPETLSQEQYRQQVANLRQKSEQLEAELSRRSAEFRTISEPVTIEAVQQLIPEDAALVEFVLYQPLDAKANQWGKPRYAAYILQSSGEPQWVDLGEAEPIERMAFFRFSLALKNSRDAFQGNQDKVKQFGRNLDELLMQPIRQKLGNVNHIIISPDSNLNLIPFAALVDENNRYLIETYKITYLTTGRDLIRLQLEYSHKQPPVIIANPDYDKPGEPTTVAVSNTRGMNQLSRGVEMSFAALPGTAEEAEVIAPLLSDVLLSDIEVLTGSKATENAIKQLQAPKILHIATHGFFLPNLPRVELDNPIELASESSPQNTRIQENPLIRSGLALAGFNPRESGEEDGVLTALEVANLRLRGTKLVVLSACETGLGSVENGEGVYGLRRAFVLAGAESQLMSLWKVNDQATKDLMIKYYQGLLENQGRSEAWRQVQLEMLNSGQYQHPYYWAAFVPVGDWSPMGF